MTPVFLYHAPCLDGFGAAWAAWKRFGESGRFLAVQYRDELPPLEGPLDIYIMDLCCPRATIDELMRRHGKVVIIDHHQSALPALAGLEGVVFATDRSAAVLAWEHFFPGTPVPLLLQYVQDYDLWRFELPQSKEVCAALGSYPMEFSVWDGLVPADLAVEGRSLLRQKAQIAELTCAHASLRPFAGHQVPVVNATFYNSEIGEELLKRFPEAPFSVTYYDREDGKRHWSLRSRTSFDVSAIARSYGGGGHRQAAGFETPLPESEFVLPEPEPP